VNPREAERDLVQLRARAETVQLGGTQLLDAPRFRLGRLSIALNHLRHLREASFMEGGAQCLKNTTAARSGSVQGVRWGQKPAHPHAGCEKEVDAPLQARWS